MMKHALPHAPTHTHAAAPKSRSPPAGPLPERAEQAVGGV